MTDRLASSKALLDLDATKALHAALRADAVDRLLAALDREVDWINLSNEFRAARHAVLKQDK